MEALQIEKKAQDETLDKMSQSLDRLGEMAKSMKTELDTQAIMIEDIENDVDAAQTKVDSTTQRVYKYIKQRPPRDWFILSALLIAFGIVLFFALR